MGLQLQPRFGELSLWTRLAEQEEAAFEIMDLFSVPAIARPEAAGNMIRCYGETGLAASLHGAFMDINPACGDPLIRELSRQRCRESCEAARALGAGKVVFHSGAFPFLRGAYLESWADSCAAFYEALAETYDLALYIENAQDLDPVPLEALMDRITSSRVGVCLDVGHAHYSRVPVEDWFARLGDRIGYLHLSDNGGSFDDHLPLGEGTIAWDRLDRCFRELGREVTVTLETGSQEATERSLSFLRQHNYFGLR